MEIIYRALLWTLFFCHHTRSEDEKCDSALGMKSKAVPDESITSSSHLDSNHKAKHGRGRFDRENKKAWCSAKEDTEPYIQIKFVEEKAITAVKTQGSSTDFIYSKKIKVMYLDGGAWTPYKEELTGNSNVQSIKMNTFHPAIRTKSIRIYPKEPFAMFNPGGKVVCLRLELYGCSAPAGCSDPGSPTNGERIGVNFDHGSQVSFSCRQGFVQVGNSTSVCYRGGWSNAPPQCKATCKDPGIPKNGYRKGSNFIDGDSVEFHCNQNYSLFGAPIVRCLEGRWSATLPECKAVCSDPGIPSNGNRIGDDFGDGQIVAYMCNENFTLVGARTVFCVAGQWNATKPTCKASCSDPGIPQRGRRIGSHFGHGIQVTFVCLPKYSLLGSQSMTCHDGKWSSIIPVCKAYCKDPGSPQNGVRHGNEFTHNKRISFTCLPGYELTGSASAVCINGKWSASVPRCKAICPDPGIPLNGSRIGNSFLDGQTVAFRCQQSYTLIGSHILRCVAGKWNNKLPECKAPCLNPAVPPNGRILNARLVNLHGARVRFACKTGFQMEGPINVKCVDGKWTSAGPSCEDIDECASGTSNCHANAVCKNTPGSYTCTCKTNSVGDGRTCLKLCANPGVLPHGERKGNQFQHGKRVTFTCEVGYRLVGSSSLTCLEGEWSSALPQCQKNCADPGFPPNGFTRGSNFQHGEKVTFVCQPGFKLAGVTSTTCNNGAWSDTVPVCRVLCKDPGIPLHGSRTGKDFEDGKTVNFTCNVGYTLFGRKTTECHKGIWSSAIPQCKITCPEPADISHGFFLGNDYSDGDTITYLCDDHYVLDGSSNMTCVDGRWEGSPPVCRAPCPVPVAPANGNVFGENHQHHAVIQYWCKQGFVLHGAISNECVDGKWNASIPSCKALCKDPGTPQHGARIGSNFEDGSTVKFTCDVGYTLVGSKTIECRGGIWSSSAPRCKQQPPSGSCRRPPVPANARMLDTQADKKWFTDGDRVFYRCQTGYAPSGFAIRRCKNGVWSRLAFRCNAKSCGHPGTPVNGELNSYVFTYNSIAQYSCNQGYTLVGSPERVCHANQTWSGILPQCTPINCGTLPTPVNGEKVTESSVLNGQVTFRCLGVQYKLVGSSTRTCLESGQWSGQQPSCNKESKMAHGSLCNRLLISLLRNPPKNTIIAINKSRLKARYRCRKGFKLLGEEYRTCRNGRWKEKEPKCLEPCGKPEDIPHATYAGSTFLLKYSCEEGYTLSGPKRRRCLGNEKWSRAPKCLQIKCRDPGKIRNGNVSTSDLEYRSGTTVTYVCKEGYELKGDETITCTEYGVWKGKRPYCKERTCPDPGRPENGYRFGFFKIGSTVRFSCQSGFELRGSKERTCMENQEWNGSLTTCQDGSTFCPVLGTPINGRKYGRKYNFGDIVKFECNSGFILKGSAVRICELNGTWNGTEAICRGEFEDQFTDINTTAFNLRKNVIDNLLEYACNNENETECNKTRLDLVFVLDASSSVQMEGFQKVLNFTKAFVKTVGASPRRGGTRVAMVTFGTEPRLEFNLGDAKVDTMEKAIEAIDKVKYMGGATASALALKMVREDIVPFARQDSHRAMMFITDGMSNKGGSPKDQAKDLREKDGFEIYAIAVGEKIARRELMDIASADDDNDHVIRVRSFASLEQAIKKAAYVEVGEADCRTQEAEVRLTYRSDLTVNKQHHSTDQRCKLKWLLMALKTAIRKPRHY